MKPRIYDTAEDEEHRYMGLWIVRNNMLLKRIVREHGFDAYIRTTYPDAIARLFIVKGTLEFDVADDVTESTPADVADVINIIQSWWDEVV